MSHNVDEDVETEIEAKDESPIGFYINLDNASWTLVYSLVNLCLGFVF